MGEGRSIARSVASSLSGYLATIVAALIMSPFIVHTLGDTAYGVLALIGSITGYYGLFDFGIRSALLVQITQAWASKDDALLNKSMNTALGVLSGIAVLALIATTVLAWKMFDWFDVPLELLESARLAILLMGFGVAFSVPFEVFQLVPGAVQRFDITNAISIIARIVLSVIIYVLLSRGLGFVGIAIAQLVIVFGSCVAGIYFSRRLLPGLRFGRRYFDRTAVKPLVQNAMHLFLGRFSNLLIDWSDAIIVGAIMKDPRAITRYTFGNNLVPYYSSAVTTIGTSLGSYAVAWQTKGEGDKVRTLLTEGVRWVGAFAAFGAGGLWFCGEDFLRQWIGEEILTGEGYPSSYQIMNIVCGAALARSLMVCIREVLIARGEAKLLSQLGLGEAASNIILSVILGHEYGLIGIAYAALIPAIVLRVFVGPIIVLRRLAVPIGFYARRLLTGPAAILLAMGAASIGFKRFITVSTVLELIALIGVVAIAGLCATLLFALNADERAKIRGAIARR